MGRVVAVARALSALLGSAIPLVESGSGSAGSSTLASRQDHVHPAAAAGGGQALQRVITYTSGSGTYTPTAGTKSLFVRMVGAGGNGGGTGGGSIAGGAAGGGAGGYLTKWITSPAASYAYAVAAGGSGAATTLGSSFLTCNAGNGGAIASGALCAGGAGGTVTGGDVNYRGTQGWPGMLASPGAGAPSVFGGGVQGSTVSGPGFPGTAAGAGGSGAYRSSGSTSYTGGPGANGAIVIEEWA